MTELRNLALRALLQRGLAHQSRLDFAEARMAYVEVLRRDPTHFDALHMLGVVAIQTDRYQAAVDLIAKALRQRPDAAAAHNNMALALVKLGRMTDAIKHYERVTASRPDCVDAHSRYAAVLLELGHLEQALESCDRAIALQPHAANPRLSRALVLRSMLRPEEALACCESATSLEPESADAWDKRGSALRDLLRLDEALACFDRAIELRPEYAQAHMNSGMLHLLRGDFEIGWQGYDWRCQPGGPVSARNWPKPPWRGEEMLSGKTVLAHAEQGFGDTIQFCRYVRLLRDAGANVILSVPQPLCNLMRCLEGPIEVRSETDQAADFDYRVPLLSLPRLFRTTETTIPGAVPYLSADAHRVRRWQAQLGLGGFKIGICWQGSRLPIDVGRSFSVGLFADIARIPGVRLISLQKGYGAEQLDSIPAGMRVERLDPNFDTGPDAFLDTAAVIECLDLVITSDTAVAHLAGALGRPTWVALKHVPDWRWMLERQDSPWYPGHRLFRQREHGEWNEVFDRLHTALLHELHLDDF
jgi:tetratricopeptide (TPR) repeat protein